MLKRFFCGVSALGLVGCASVPPLTLFDGDQTSIAPAGLKVAALVAHVKCELWYAAHSTNKLDFFYDELALGKRPANDNNDGDPRQFNLRNIFTEIEYVGQASFLLDVTHTASINPSLSFIHPYAAASTAISASTPNLTLAVGGNLSEVAHRQLNFNASIDFARLVPTKDKEKEGVRDKQKKDVAYSPFWPKEDPDNGYNQPGSPVCNNGTGSSGTDLEGNLGLEETLAEGLIAASMSDVALFPDKQSQDAQRQVKSAPIIPATAAVSVPTTSTSGVFGAVIDFTITAGINGGPNWTLNHFKGPAGSGGGNSGGSGSTGSSGSAGSGGGNQGLFNFNRQTKDTLIISFVPICIRSPYKPIGDPKKYPLIYPKKTIVVGTPAWANYLPLCTSQSHLMDEVNAANKGDQYNLFLLNSLIGRGLGN